jgi:hypothetical protein
MAIFSKALQVTAVSRKCGTSCAITNKNINLSVCIYFNIFYFQFYDKIKNEFLHSLTAAAVCRPGFTSASLTTENKYNRKHGRLQPSETRMAYERRLPAVLLFFY